MTQFKTNCTDGQTHTPEDYMAQVTTCTKCKQVIKETSLDSGYWFTDVDSQEWEKQYGFEDCLSCIRVQGKTNPNKVTKKLLTGFPVCDDCYDRYQPDLEKAESKKDRKCPQCQKKFGVGFAGFCSETCFNARMDQFTKKETKN